MTSVIGGGSGGVNKIREVKVVLLGATGVGKSSLALQFCQRTFDPYSESTIGASFMSRNVVVDGNTIKYQIWDTAGQEQYNSLTRMYYRNAAVAVIVYDITRKSSFTNACKQWVSELNTRGPPDVVLALVGNKSDMDDQREVTQTDASKYAQQIGALFVEASAKTAHNVDLLFEELAKLLPPEQKVNNNNGDLIELPNSMDKRGKNQQSGCC